MASFFIKQPHARDTHGPYTKEALESMATKGLIGPAHLVSTDGEEWLPASLVISAAAGGANVNQNHNHDDVAHSSHTKRNQFHQSDKKYYLVNMLESERPTGPWSIHQLQDMLTSNKIGNTHRICPDGGSKWERIDSILNPVDVHMPQSTANWHAPQVNAGPMQDPAQFIRGASDKELRRLSNYSACITATTYIGFIFAVINVMNTAGRGVFDLATILNFCAAFGYIALGIMRPKCGLWLWPIALLIPIYYRVNGLYGFFLMNGIFLVITFKFILMVAFIFTLILYALKGPLGLSIYAIAWGSNSGVTIAHEAARRGMRRTITGRIKKL